VFLGNLVSDDEGYWPVSDDASRTGPVGLAGVGLALTTAMAVEFGFVPDVHS